MKSNMEIYSNIGVALYTDVVEQYPIVSVKDRARDLLYYKYEESDHCDAHLKMFLTVHLPSLGKALDRALSSGTAFDLPVFFSKKKGTKLPSFLGGLFKLVFNDHGIVRNDACVDAVRDIRQVCSLFYKLELTYEDKQTQAVVASFVRVETELNELSLDFNDETLTTARSLITRIFHSFDPYAIKPAHGPGAVATGEKNNTKHMFKRFYKNIDDVYAYAEYFSLPTRSFDRDWYDKLEDHDSGTAKVVLVPKDSRGPRLISCEPLEYMWMQQGLGRAIMAHLESHPMTSGRVNFTSQEVNRELALEGSVLRTRNSEWVTLDMKDASDRVSVKLVENLFHDVPRLLRCLLALRTNATILPNGQVQTLQKFAPMGSALCFPIEAVCFWALSVAAIVVDRYKALTDREGMQEKLRRAVLKDSGDTVYVYGDDIIVTSATYRQVMAALPRFGLVFNADKCCVAGSFRESCGMDAFQGADVTPLKIRTTWCDRRTATTYSSYIAYINTLRIRGYERAATYIEDELTEIYGPIFASTEPVLSFPYIRHSDDWDIRLGTFRDLLVRWNADYQRYEGLVWTIVTPLIKGNVDNWEGLLRHMLASAEFSVAGTYSLPRRARLTKRWRPIPADTAVFADSWVGCKTYSQFGSRDLKLQSESCAVFGGQLVVEELERAPHDFPLLEG